jgi:hypothetical protein
MPIILTHFEPIEEGYEGKKIILTTDPQLIADGVQAIDDEFLEWFVKNPSCRKIETESFCKYGGDCPSQGAHDKQYLCDIGYKIILPKEEPEQETLEEAAKKQWGNVHRTGVLGFIEGAKWQQEQDKNKYSEVEVLELLYQHTEDLLAGKKLTLLQWFEQFKKK